MDTEGDEEKLLRAVVLQNSQAVLRARERAERDLMRAKESLQQTTELLSNILESITDGFVSFDLEWRIVYLNRRAEEILRPLYPAKESLMGKVHWEAFADTLGTPLEAHYRRALRDRVTVQFEHFYGPLNSWFDIRAYPSPNGLSVFFQDITERKRNEEALRQQQEWFAVTLASIGDAVITTDTEGKVTFLNPVAEMITGWGTSEAVGQHLNSVFKIINERTRCPAVNPVSKVLRDGKVVELANHTALITRNGREIAIEDSAAPIRDMRGQIAGAVMVFHDVTERRRAEEAVRESEERFSALVLATAQIVWVADAGGGFVEDSPSWREFTGQSVEEMKGWGRLDVIHPQEHEALKAAWRRAIAAKSTLAAEYRLRHRSGAWRWASVRAVPMLAADGSIRSWVGMHSDITERRLAENSLRESENRKSAILSASLDAIISMPHLGRISDFNPAAERMFGYSHAAVQGRLVAELIIPERLRERHRQGMERYLAAGEARVLGRRIEMPALRSDGTEFPVELSITRIPNIEPPMFTATLRDLTERKQIEEVRFRLAAVVESSDDAIISKTLDGIITSWNNGAKLMYGYEPEEVLGQHITILIPPHLREEEPEILDRLRRGEKIEHYETVRVRKDGSLVDVSLSVSPIKDASGEIIGASKIARDISERKRMDQERRRKEDELRALADSMPQLAWMAQPDGNIFWYNQRWYEYTGTTPEQMEGWGWQAVHDPEILPHVLERWKESLATGRFFEMEFPLRGADGVFRWFLTRVSPVRDHEGRVLRWLGTNTDVDTVRKTQHALREESRILELLNDTGAAIASQLDLQRLVQTVTDSATKLCGAKFGAFFYNVINEQGEAFLLYTLSGAPREAFEKFGMPRNTPVFNPTFTGQGIVRSPDILQDARYGKLPPHHGMPKGHLPVRSYLAVPVTSRSGEIIGGLFFGHPEANVFSDKSERLIVGIAAQAAIAIDNARLYDAAQREIAERKRAETELARRVQLTSLRAEIAAAIALNESWDVILQRCTNSLVKYLDAAFARVWVLNPEDGVLKLRASSGMYTHLDGPHGRVPVGEFKIGRIAQTRQPHLTNDVQHDPNISDPAWAQREGMVAFAGYPLLVEEKVVGVIAIFARHVLSDEVLKELSLIVDGLAQWIQRRRAEEALRESEQKLAEANADLDIKVQQRTASLLEALSQLEEFSYSVSHDLRAPVRAISGYNQIVLADYGATLPPDALPYLHKIGRSAQWMERLINDVLTMSRVARSAIQLHPLALQSFIGEIIEQHPSMQQPDANVTLDTPHTVNADDASLHQALLNLLNNAVKFVLPGEKPTVRVRSEKVGNRVRIWIEDHGIGIPPQHRGKLFGMFQRLPTEGQFEGTGIGLAIVRKAVERMGGTVGMEPNEPRGSRFWIELREAQ